MRPTFRLALALAFTTIATTALADTPEEHGQPVLDPSAAGTSLPTLDLEADAERGIDINVRFPFLAFVHTIDPWTEQSMMNVSWHPGCPVPISDLRAVDMTYWGFDKRPHWGRLIVHHDVSASVVRAFKAMYTARFPIRRMEPVDRYGGSDDASMLADNTSAFNCRAKTGGTTFSIHSYGRAIDINTVENPYVKGALVLPSTGAPFADRTNIRPGMILEGDLVTRAFDLEGFDWGGRWTSLKDYQHFEIVPPTN
ncbi:M15 family metallopeptidase [Pendulispora albinea]|uniref:M15 family metallopeptidase n=1 Tax=Pendulispora albinea TaxID=2741071 RepID=A0ABZ2M5A5_9BACT